MVTKANSSGSKNLLTLISKVMKVSENMKCVMSNKNNTNTTEERSLEKSTTEQLEDHQNEKLSECN